MFRWRYRELSRKMFGEKARSPGMAGWVLLLAAGLTLLILSSRHKMSSRNAARLPNFFVGFFRLVNRFIPWHRLPPWFGVMNLIALRQVLREKNLYDTSQRTLAAASAHLKCEPRTLGARTSEGTCNDLQVAAMGAAGQRFGRNVPLEHAFPEKEPALLTPSPRVISRRLLTRENFIPADTLNLLAAAWIQFQVHDWFSHTKSDQGDDFKILLDKEDNWADPEMRVRRTAPDPTRLPAEAESPPTYLNQQSHWWDGSQIYGDTEAITSQLRNKQDGKLIFDEKAHLLPIDPATGLERTGFADNWWIGLSLLHNLFAAEHNAIYDALQSEYPDWSSDQLFDTARLINTALMAKIHTVEWTPGILAHPTLQIAMNANWWGLLSEKIAKTFGRLSSNEVISGIPGSPNDHHGVPYALTEEFAAVYRLHSLIPDEIEFYSVSNGQPIKKLEFPQVTFAEARKVLDDGTTMADVFYSFGITHPGAITLHNFPRFLQDLTLPDGEHLDLAAVDILRDRERGIPRYNLFRQLLHLPPVRSFEELTNNRVWAEELREVYQGDIDRVDLLVGCLAEPFPKGFGFGDTAFRIFILMASRRLKSDRFFTTDYRPEIYTPLGLDWINQNTFSSVLIRHYPELKPALRGVRNPFAPWSRIG
jgi:Animal haem peroxidase